MYGDVSEPFHHQYKSNHTIQIWTKGHSAGREPNDYQVLGKLSRQHHEVLGRNGKTVVKRAIAFGIHKIHLQKFISEYLESKTGKAVGIFSHFLLLHFIFISREGEGQIVFEMKVFMTMM